MEHRLAAVIPYYKGREYIAKCLKSLEESTRPPEVVYIIDNCPDGIHDNELRGRYKLNLKHIKAQVGIGFARACNIGVKFAYADGFKYLFFLNQDGFVEVDTVELLSRNLPKDAYTATPLCLTYDKKGFSEFFLKEFLCKHNELISDLYLNKVMKEFYYCRPKSFNGSCFLMNLSNFDKVKYFDPRFYMYGEEHDLFRRAQEKGLSFVVVPNAKFYHVHSNASSSGGKLRIIRLLNFHVQLLETLRTSRGLGFLKNILVTFFSLRILSKIISRRLDVSMRMMVLHFRFLKKIPSFMLIKSEDDVNDLAEKSIQKDFIKKIEILSKNKIISAG